jgi:hypothetical protein
MGKKDEQSSLGVGEGRRGVYPSFYPSSMGELKKKEYLQIMCNHTNLLLRDSSFWRNYMRNKHFLV